MTPLLRFSAIGAIMSAFAIGAFMPPKALLPGAFDPSTHLAHPGDRLIAALNRLDPPAPLEQADKPLPDWVMKDVSAKKETLPPAPPPEPDIAATFRGELRAIIYDAGKAFVLMSGGASQRKLGAGDAYRNGWSIQSVHSAEVILVRKGVRRNISLFVLSATPKPKQALKSTPNAQAAKPMQTVSASREWRRGDPRQMAPRRPRRHE